MNKQHKKKCNKKDKPKEEWWICNWYETLEASFMPPDNKEAKE